MSNVNDNIRNFRKFRGLSQRDLAKKVNKSTNVVSNWENGIHSPDLDTVEDICKILKVTPDQIFGWEKNSEYEQWMLNTIEYQNKIKSLISKRDELNEQIAAYTYRAKQLEPKK